MKTFTFEGKTEAAEKNYTTTVKPSSNCPVNIPPLASNHMLLAGEKYPKSLGPIVHHFKSRFSIYIAI